MPNEACKATTFWRNFKAPWLQTERTSNEGSSEKLSFNGEQFESFKQKYQKIRSSYGEQNKKTTRRWRQKLNMNQVARTNLTEANLKKAFRIKLFEICKTRTKKSSPDLLNFYVISASHDMAIDAGRATTCRRNFKAPWLQTERTKMKGLLKKWALTGNSLKISNQKNQKIESSYWEQNKRTTRLCRQKLNMNRVLRKKLTEANLKKAFRLKLFELCKTRTKKSSPDLFNFFIKLPSHDKANYAGRATTCRRIFKAPWLQTERTKNEGPSEKLSFNGEQFEFFKPKNQKIQSSYGEQNKRTTRPRRQNLNMNHVIRKKLTEANLKKAFRIKLFELCKTRTKESSPDLYKFM